MRFYNYKENYKTNFQKTVKYENNTVSLKQQVFKQNQTQYLTGVLGNRMANLHLAVNHIACAIH